MEQEAEPQPVLLVEPVTRWINGGGFGQGLLSGLKGAGIGAVSGAISGGIVKGIKDAKNGFSFWNGTSIQAVPDIGSTSILSDQSALNDEALQALIKQEFQISEGGFKSAENHNNPF
ncbi:MAG: hypothetical protein ACLR8Y_09735 [Alistipes indistinctus]